MTAICFWDNFGWPFERRDDDFGEEDEAKPKRFEFKDEENEETFTHTTTTERRTKRIKKRSGKKVDLGAAGSYADDAKSDSNNSINTVSQRQEVVLMLTCGMGINNNNNIEVLYSACIYQKRYSRRWVYTYFQKDRLLHWWFQRPNSVAP